MVWKRKIIETLLVLVIVLMLRVLTYVVSYWRFRIWIGVISQAYKLFLNEIGVARCVSQEVWFDKGFVIWHFLNYCLEQIVSMWSLSVGVWLFFATKELVDKISNLQSDAHHRMINKKIHYERMRCRPDFPETKCAAGKTYQTKCAAGPNFWPSPYGYSVLLMQ